MGRMIEKVQSLTRSEKKDSSSRTYTRGELTMIHTEAEAERFIAQGKYAMELDEDGDEVYRKTTHTHSKSLEMTEAMSRKRTADVTEDVFFLGK